VGYWIVMAMVAVAIVAVLIAAIAEEARTEQDRRAPAGPAVWVALGTNGTNEPAAPMVAPHWVALVQQALGDRVVGYDFTRGGCTAADVQRDSLDAAVAAQPDAVAIWVGPDDFLLGEEIGAFERRLWHVLSTLGGIGSRLVVADIPDLSALSSPAAEEEPAALSEELGHWNAAIARLTAAAKGVVVRLGPTSESPTDLFAADDDRLVLTETGHRWIAGRFAPAVAAAVGAEDILDQHTDSGCIVESQPPLPAAPPNEGAS
jgi:hypothetical protein